MEVAKNVDLQRYAGKWYEIAALPTRFQPKNGTNTTAKYTLNPDNTIHVLNETWVNKKQVHIDGTAWKADPKSAEAKLLVRFMVPPFLPVIPVTGDYWVLAVDEDYQWALVGNPKKTNLWVLSRTPQMDEEVYQNLLDRATKEGYDVSKVHKTPQPEGVVPEADEVEKETKGTWWLKSALGK